MTASPINILTMKWGTMYGPEYVNRLAAGVSRHLTLPHRFICFTDDSTGLDEGVQAMPLPQLTLPGGQEDTRWRKLGLFNSDLFGLKGTGLFLDLDQVIVGSLNIFFQDDAPFRIIRDDDLFRPKPLRRINPERDRFLASVGNSSVFRYQIGQHSYIAETYSADPAAAMTAYEISQQFQSAQLEKHGHLNYWPQGLCVSFKNHCVPPGMKSFFADPALPKDARIVVFAGSPKMDDALNGRGSKWYRRIGDVTWLRDAWINP